MTPSEIWAGMENRLIAILRGIHPTETAAIVSELLDLGYRAIEVPMNSPDALKSIEIAADTAASQSGCLIGAGTVLDVRTVRDVQAAGGNVIVSPNVDMSVIAETVQAGMASFPGVFTPSEAHLALQSGATGLKFFPASALGAGGIKAVMATLPPDTSICAVGGVGAHNFAEYCAVGITAFGLGSNLYSPGDDVETVRRKAKETLTAYQSIA